MHPDLEADSPPSDSCSRPIRAGRAFRNGKLYEFSKLGIIVATQWPDMRAWRKTPKGKQWVHIRPALRLSKREADWDLLLDPREQNHKAPRASTPIRYLIERGLPKSRVEIEEIHTLPEMQRPEVPIPDGTNAGFEEWLKRQQDHDAALAMEFLRPIPQEILKAVLPFRQRHWHLLNLIARCPEAEDLLASTPALAYALASMWVFRMPPPQRPLRAARSLVRKSQVQIATWLGFPGGWSTIRILRKLPPSECSIPTLLALRKLLPEKFMILRHLHRLDREVIAMMAREHDRYSLTTRFLREVIDSQNPIPNAGDCLRDVAWMLGHLECKHPLPIRSWRHLVSTHDGCVNRIGRADLRIEFPILHPLPPFPEPPLHVMGDVVEVEPLRSEEELMVEGQTQRNCAGGYGPSVRRGEAYLYRMLQPERATLAVNSLPTGTWALSEIKAIGNTAVSVETLAAAKEWVEMASLAAGCSNANGDGPF